jgi:hypothetical protein
MRLRLKTQQVSATPRQDIGSFVQDEQFPRTPRHFLKSDSMHVPRSSVWLAPSSSLIHQLDGLRTNRDYGACVLLGTGFERFGNATLVVDDGAKRGFACVERPLAARVVLSKLRYKFCTNPLQETLLHGVKSAQ